MKLILPVFLALLLNTVLWGQNNYNMTSVGQLPYTQNLSSIWGWSASNGTEYALVGTTTGTSIVSLANPANPVEVQFIPGVNTSWRELKTYGNYCYVACDNCNEGLLIIDLSTLPNSVNYTYHKPLLTVNAETDSLRSIHTLYIDNGYLYLAGTNLDEGQVLLFNLTNPWSPQMLGYLPNTYAHDMFVRGDTMWVSNIFAGYFSVWDVTNKANPTNLAQQTTPNNFTHNTWISNDGQTLFTTDERANAFVAAYNVSDLSNISELDRWQTFETRGSGVIPHNAHVIGDDYVVTSYYTDGVVILDGSRPNNLVEIARYDTYLQSNIGFYGCWGVYPYFPSGLIAASDINTGLHILQPTYQHACWLEGNVTDTITNNPIGGVLVELDTTAIFDNSVLNGDYKTGYGISGTYSVRFSKSGYYPKTITGVSLQHGVVNILDVQLMPMTAFGFSGQVVDADNGNAPVPNAVVYMVSPNYTHNTTADANGNFTIPAMYQDNYDIYAGKWGYQTNMVNMNINAATTTPTIAINQGYRDEFILDLGWTVAGNASSGMWERAVSEGILYQGQLATPDEDYGFDLGNMCYISGANNNGTLSADDIDGGNIILTSPIFDISNYGEAHVSFYAWFVDIQGSGQPNDSLIARIYNGSTSAILQVYDQTAYDWSLQQDFKISDFITPTNTMWVTFEAFDRSPGHVVETGIDLFEVTDAAPIAVKQTAAPQNSFELYPNPFSNTVILDILSDGNLGQQLQVFNAQGQLLEAIKIAQAGKTQLTIGENWPAGIYFVQWNGQSRKVVKMP